MIRSGRSPVLSALTKVTPSDGGTGFQAVIKAAPRNLLVTEKKRDGKMSNQGVSMPFDARVNRH